MSYKPSPSSSVINMPEFLVFTPLLLESTCLHPRFGERSIYQTVFNTETLIRHCLMLFINTYLIQFCYFLRSESECPSVVGIPRVRSFCITGIHSGKKTGSALLPLPKPGINLSRYRRLTLSQQESRDRKCNTLIFLLLG